MQRFIFVIFSPRSDRFSFNCISNTLLVGLKIIWTCIFLQCNNMLKLCTVHFATPTIDLSISTRLNKIAVATCTRLSGFSFLSDLRIRDSIVLLRADILPAADNTNIINKRLRKKCIIKMKALFLSMKEACKVIAPCFFYKRRIITGSLSSIARLREF